MAKRVDYLGLVEVAVADPIAAFKYALASGDPIAIAIVLIVGRAEDETAAVQLLRAFLDHEHGREVDTDLISGIFTFCEEGELTQAAETVLREKYREVAIVPGQAKLVTARIGADGPAKRRGLLLLWLYTHDPKAGVAAARGILEDTARPHDEVSGMAIQVLGVQRGQKYWDCLVAYAERHVGEEINEAEAAHDPAAALAVLNGLREIRDIDAVGQIMARLAQFGVGIGKSLDRLFGRLSKDELAQLVAALGTGGHGGWVASECLPGLLRVRARDIAGSVAGRQWSAECLSVLAQTNWEQFNPKLYPVVLRGLHKQEYEAVRKHARVKARVYCEAQAEGDPVREAVGATLVTLCLGGVVSLDDEDVSATLRNLSAEELLSAINAVSWKSRRRAEVLGQLVGQINPPVLVELSEGRVGEHEEGVEALLEGAAGPALNETAADLVRAVKGSQIALGTLSRLSENGAGAVLLAWTGEHSMPAFRAFAESSRAEERLENIPAEVREYQRYSAEERRELLEAYGHGEERGNMLVGILSDWAKTGKNSPQREDLTYSLNLLGDDLEAGGDADAALALLSEICQSPDVEVRRAVYQALGRARATESVVGLLLERHQHEVPGVKDDVGGALVAVAERLDGWAGDRDREDRGYATRQLARIDSSRALPHARQLLDANRSQDRLIAAQILGQSGTPDTDAQILRQRAEESEPEANVREEMVRAARRLEVGDTFDAHIRIGEMVGIRDQAAWARLDPKEVWGRWVNLLVPGLNRLSQAEASAMWGEGIDALDEVGKILLFRAIAVHGEEINISQKVRTRVEANKEDYGGILYTQQIISNWRWTSHFASLHDTRTAHLAKKGETEPVPEPEDSDLEFAYDLFKLGGAPCCFLLTGVK